MLARKLDGCGKVLRDEADPQRREGSHRVSVFHLSKLPIFDCFLLL